MTGGGGELPLGNSSILDGAYGPIAITPENAQLAIAFIRAKGGDSVDLVLEMLGLDELEVAHG